jgi:hypothetical protein
VTRLVKAELAQAGDLQPRHQPVPLVGHRLYELDDRSTLGLGQPHGGVGGGLTSASRWAMEIAARVVRRIGTETSAMLEVPVTPNGSRAVARPVRQQDPDPAPGHPAEKA